MDIFPLGHSSFKIKGKNASVVTDPYDPDMVGLKFPKHISAQVVTVSHSHPDHNFIQVVEDESEPKLVFSAAGEYEAKGVEFVGVETYHDEKQGGERGKNTIFKIVIDGVIIVHCGDLGHVLTEEQVGQLDDVHVLFVPVGGYYTIDAKKASQVIRQLEPRIVIPMHYQRPGLDQKAFGQLMPVSLFLKELGKEGVVPVPKLKVTKDTLPEDLSVVVLE